MDANLLFDAFASATTFSRIQQLFGQLCTFLEIDQFDSATVYKNLKNKLTDWRAKELWSVLDRRATQKEYCGQAACKKLNVLVIGAGPCGLRSAIECALLGAHVVLVEQRDCFSRNNVLHIWPFVIQDLKNLGIKIFYPKFCRGSIDHISIRQLQIFLAKVALIVGVQIHDSVTFRNLIFPKSHNSGLSGWRAQFQPSNHILSEYIFDALIGADGKRNSLPGFPKQEMRGKLAIGITANFINQRTLEEEKVPEISGVSYIFNQQFFKEMKELTGVDLENIVYYKDETHYFVMCAKKQSLLEKGVIIEDNEDISLLLSPDNVNQEKLCDYAASAADFATEGKLPALQFAINHNEKEDVAMFDFTSFYSAKCSVRLVERHDQRLIMAIVGDSLHEPFWPTGSGIARGFLGVFDTSWMLRSYGLNHEGIMLLLAERESAYRLLAQAKPDNLQKQLEKYTIDPRTRYVSFELSVQPHEISHLVDTDNPRHIETNRPLPLRNFVDSSFIKSYKIWRFCQNFLSVYKLKIYNLNSCWDDGRALAALVSKFRPDILDYISLCSLQDADRMIQTVFTVLQSNCEIEPPAYNLCEWKSLPSADRINYLSNIIRTFQADSKRMRETLENAITNAAHKRKAKVQVDASKAKKTEPILRRTSSLLKAFSSVVEGDKSDDKIMNDFLDGEQGCLDDEKIREVLLEMNDEEMKQKQKRDQRLKVFEECFNKSSKCNEKEVKFWTKRPVVEKLHPERLFTVEKIISGELEAEKNRELYHNKRRLANIFTRKMEKKDIDEMEMKLEQTGMGVLFDKEHFRVMSSKEQKIISANAAAARQIASDGFKHDNNKFKDIDEKLAKADNILKNQNLAGINTVSRALKKPSLTPAPRPAPPTPPKKVSLREFANHSELEQCSDQENGKISFRNASLSKTKNGRPVSMPIIGLSCESVNARRQVCCQLCTKFVYLAERMQVEGMFIHKSCFRCAYCEQPLRLGHCAQDRNLHQFNPRFYCMQHVNLPLAEKLLRLEKLKLRSSARSGDVRVQQISLSANNSSATEIPPKSKLRVQKDVSVNEKPRLSDLNSPSTLLNKTMEKMRAQRRAIDSVMEIEKSTTPERAKFETSKRHQRIHSKDKNQKNKQHSNDISVNSTLSNCNIVQPLQLERNIGQASNDCSSTDEEEFVEADLIELENVVAESIDGNLSDAQAMTLLQSFIKRRMINYGKLETERKKESNAAVKNNRKSSEMNTNHLSFDFEQERDSTFEENKFQENNFSIDAAISNRIAKGFKPDNLKKTVISNHSFLENFNNLSSEIHQAECNNRLDTIYQKLFLICSNDVISDDENLAENESREIDELNIIRKEIRRIQRRARKISKKNEEERIRTAKDIQKTLQETELRKNEVIVVGTDLEKRLKEDNENDWILEQWLLYVHEFDQLRTKEEELSNKIQLLDSIDEYKMLQKQLKFLQVQSNESGEYNNAYTEKDLLKHMLEIVEKRDNLKKLLEKRVENAEQRNPIKASENSRGKKDSYLNYDPVFV